MKLSKHEVLPRVFSNGTPFADQLACPIVVCLALPQTVAFPQDDHHDFAATVAVL